MSGKSLFSESPPHGKWVDLVVYLSSVRVNAWTIVSGILNLILYYECFRPFFCNWRRRRGRVCTVSSSIWGI
jgi:hypothetical protein